MYALNFLANINLLKKTISHSTTFFSLSIRLFNKKNCSIFQIVHSEIKGCDFLYIEIGYATEITVYIEVIYTIMGYNASYCVISQTIKVIYMSNSFIIESHMRKQKEKRLGF